MDWPGTWAWVLFAFSLRFRKYHVNKTANKVTIAPKAAPPITLPAITPALGVLELVLALELPFGSADGVTVTVTAPDLSVTAEAGPLLPVSLRIPARDVVWPDEVNKMVLVSCVVLSVHECTVKPFSNRYVAQNGFDWSSS